MSQPLELVDQYLQHDHPCSVWRAPVVTQYLRKHSEDLDQTRISLLIKKCVPELNGVQLYSMKNVVFLDTITGSSLPKHIFVCVGDVANFAPSFAKDLKNIHPEKQPSFHVFLLNVNLEYFTASHWQALAEIAAIQSSWTFQHPWGAEEMVIWKKNIRDRAATIFAFQDQAVAYLLSRKKKMGECFDKT